MEAPAILSPLLNCAHINILTNKAGRIKTIFRNIIIDLSKVFDRRVSNKYNGSDKTCNAEIFSNNNNGMKDFPLPLIAVGKTEFSVYF